MAPIFTGGKFAFGRSAATVSSVVAGIYTGSAFPILNTIDAQGQVLSSGTRTDPNSSTLQLALPLTVSGGNSLTTETTGKTVTSTNVNSSSSNFKFYGSSSLNTTTSPSYFGLPSQILDFSQSFTIETWIYRPTGVGAGIWSDGNGPVGGGLLWLSFAVSDSGNLTLYSYPSSTNNSTNGTVPANTWTHIAFVKNGSTMTYFIGGVKDTYTNTWNSPGGTTASFQAMYTNNAVQHQDYRIYVGLAKYTNNFTP